MIINELILKNLPHKPGIYIFKNDKKEILYVGKAKNLQTVSYTHLTLPTNREV